LYRCRSRDEKSAAIIALFDGNDERLTKMADTPDYLRHPLYKEVLAMKPDWIDIELAYIASSTKYGSDFKRVECALCKTLTTM
jgi:hypothetical protein